MGDKSRENDEVSHNDISLGLWKGFIIITFHKISSFMWMSLILLDRENNVVVTLSKWTLF